MWQRRFRSRAVALASCSAIVSLTLIAVPVRTQEPIAQLINLSEDSSDVAPGWGYDSLTGNFFPPCVTGTIELGQTGTTDEVRWSMDQARTRRDERSSGSGSIGGSWGGGHASASFSFRKVRAENSFSVYSTLYSKSTRQTKSLTGDVVLTKRGRTGASRGPAEFRRLCGDRVVWRVTSGGMIVASIRTNARSLSERNSTRAQVEAQSGTVSGSGSTEQSRLMERISKRSSLSVRRYGVDPQAHPMPRLASIGDLRSYAFRLPSEVTMNSAVPFSAEVRDYSIVEDMSEAVTQELPSDVRSALRHLRTRYEHAAFRRNDLAYALANPAEFICLDIEQARADLRTVSAYSDAIEESLDRCYSEPSVTACASPENHETQMGSSAVRRYESFYDLAWNARNDMAVPVPHGQVCRIIGSSRGTGAWSQWANDNHRSCRGRPQGCWDTCPALNISGGRIWINNPDTGPADNRSSCRYLVGCVLEVDVSTLQCGDDGTR